MLVAMSGGVDSSVAAALLRDAGHDVVGATMKLWGGDSDTGCCSVADVDDARRVAQQLGIAHHVFNFTDDFDRDVVAPYVAGHAAGRTPNPCIECNRHLKFDRLLRPGRAARASTPWPPATTPASPGRRTAGTSCAGASTPPRTSPTCCTCSTQTELGRILLPVGELTKAEVRAEAARLGLRTAAKPDSQDVCFITRAGGRRAFLGDRIPLHPGRLVEQASGEEVGRVEAVELVTVGQRRGMGAGPEVGAAGTGVGVPGAAGAGPPAAGPPRRYALAVDVTGATVTVGSLDDLLVDRLSLDRVSWVDAAPAPGALVEVQMSAHGQPVDAVVGPDATVGLLQRQRRVAPGQSVVLYRGDVVVGGGLAR